MVKKYIFFTYLVQQCPSKNEKSVIKNVTWLLSTWSYLPKTKINILWNCSLHTPSLWDVSKLYFLWTLKRTAAVQLRFTNCIYLYFVSGPSLCQFCINEICQEKWHQYSTNTFICMLWRKRRRKNVKRPDSPDVDREGGRPTKMWDI